MENTKRYAFILLGKPGSGKGVASKILNESLKEKHNLESLIISTGDQYRQSFLNKNNTIKINEHNLNILKEQSSGKIQDPVASTAMWVAKIWADWTGQPSVIMEGSPRTILELYNLESFLKNYCQMSLIYLEIFVEDELAIKNMFKRNLISPRDDTSSSINISRRLEEYYIKTAPSIGVIAKNSKNFWRLTNNKDIGYLNDKINIILYNLYFQTT